MALDLSRARVRNGEDDNFHFEVLRWRIRIDVGRTDTYSLDILLNLVGVSAAIDEDVFDTGVC